MGVPIFADAKKPQRLLLPFVRDRRRRSHERQPARHLLDLGLRIDGQHSAQASDRAAVRHDP